MVVFVATGACSKDDTPKPKPSPAPVYDAAAKPSVRAKPDDKREQPRTAPRPPKTCKAAPGWRYERIALPPQFAPTMKPGTEELYFAPGMFKPAAADYFSYVFSLAFEQPRTFDEASLRALLNTYYRGLMSAVAKGKKRALDPKTIDSKLTRTKTGFSATVSVVDAFTTHKPLGLHMQLTVDKACLRAAVSPAKPGSAIWAQLDKALSCVPCP